MKYPQSSRRGGRCIRPCVEPLEDRRLLAATYYVSLRGSDANSGIDAQHAWRHIQEAMNAATPGSTVLVQPGTYNEKLTVNVSGNATDGYITFQAQGHVTVSGTGIAGADIINLNNQNYIQIVGFNIANDLLVSDGSGIRMNGHDDHISLLNNTVHTITGASAMAITAYGTDPNTPISNLVIDGNQIYACSPAQSETVSINGNVNGFQVSNNYIHNVNNIGIDAIGGERMSSNPATDIARNGSIINNRVTGVHHVGAGRDGAGISVDGGQNIVVERNTCWANDVGIEVNAVNAGAVTTNVIVRDNYVYANWGVGISIGASQQADGTVTGCSVTNNTLVLDNTHHTEDGELRLQWGTDNTIENNLLEANRFTLLLDGEYGSSGDAVNYNLYYSPAGVTAPFMWDGFSSTGLGSFQSGSHQDSNSQFANPLLIGPGAARPRLNPRSPAINAGNPSFTPASGETDLYGNPRLLGTSVDMGAIEVA